MAAESGKTFDLWNISKKRIDAGNRKVLFQEGEIWWCQTGVNIGIEQDGKSERFTRPVLFFKRYNFRHLLVIPLTTQKIPTSFGHPIKPIPIFLKKQSWCVFSQIRAIDSKRLVSKMGKLYDFVFEDIKKKVSEHLNIETS